MNRSNLYKGIAIMLCSSLFTCTGQLLWKLSSQHNQQIMILAGFALYGCGALLMIIALRFGDLSVLHPMLGIGYVLSVILGDVVLHEAFEIKKIVGIAVILFGLVCLSRANEEERE